jgi:hypothetical protein
MNGHILGFTRSTGTGTITGEDGHRYGFVSSEWRSDEPVCAGIVVDFEVRGEEAIGIYPVNPKPRQRARWFTMDGLKSLFQRLKQKR